MATLTESVGKKTLDHLDDVGGFSIEAEGQSANGRPRTEWRKVP